MQAGLSTKLEAVNALRFVGLEQGDIVFCHLGMSQLGFPKDMGEQKSGFDVLYEAILEVIGPQGTFLTPTYTYSFCKGEIYDPLNTPSTVGPFGEHFRKKKGAKRSLDPIFSVAGIGPKLDDLFADLPKSCFGVDCIYDRLEKANAKLCNIGVSIYYATAVHHVEQMERVPHRFLKLFSGFIKKGDRLVKENWIYGVRVLGEFSGPQFDRIEEQAIEDGVWHQANLGSRKVVCITFKDLFEVCRKRIRKDPMVYAVEPGVYPIQAEKKRVIQKRIPVHLPENASMEEMIAALWRLPRDIVSDGFDAAINALAEQVPMTLHEYLPGMECFTWIIPEKWICHEAHLETVDGKRLFSYRDNPLHVVSYSLAFEGEVSREELFKHLHTHPRLDDAIPFVFKYYERDWGLCCSRTLKNSLADDKYRVTIKTDFIYSTLKVGEVVIKGKSEESVVLCAHLCHPHMVNDDLAGVVVGISVMRELLKRESLRYTYRFVIVPETIGSAAYLSHNEDLIPFMRGGLFLEMLGTDHPHSIQRSYNGNAEMDKCVELIVKEHDPDAWSGDFLQVCLNDERMYNAPGVRVPMVSLSRVLPSSYPESPYKEYHSSTDTPDRTNFRHLQESRDVVIEIIDAIEHNFVPVPKFKGEVFFSRFSGVDYGTMGHDVLKIIFKLDGIRSVADIAIELKMTFNSVRKYIDILKNEGLVG